ncbi:MAG: hypothetical protein IIB57_12875, partial [Planctomycetes bacterium]|nr:hypothetical protein [Planctomycetota bacterium]
MGGWQSSFGPTHFRSELADRFNAAGEQGLKNAGTGINRLEASGLFNKKSFFGVLGKKPMTGSENFALLDALEGRVAPNKLTSNLRKIFNVIDGLRTQIAIKARTNNMRITLANGKKVPFVPRKDFFAHVTPNLKQLKKGTTREAVLNNSVRIGRFSNRAEAERVLDSWVNFVEKGGRG